MSSPKVLIVEDDPLAARAARRRIEAMGWLPLGPLVSGEEAVVRVGHEPPDLVLMDVTLLGTMKGPEASRIILERFGIRSVFATALTDRDTIELCKAAQPLGYLVKPYDGVMFDITLELAMHAVETMRAHAEEQRVRQRVEARHAQVLNHSGDGIVMLEADGRILVFNPKASAMFGLSEAEARVVPFPHLFNDDAIGEALGVAARQPAQAQGRVLRLQVEATHRDGAPFPTEVQFSWFVESDGLRVVAVIRDLSEATMLQQQLDHAQRLDTMSRLAPSIVHDFNNLLQAIAANQYVEAVEKPTRPLGL